MTVTVNFSGLDPITEAINNLAKALGNPGGNVTTIKERSSMATVPQQSTPVQQDQLRQPVPQQAQVQQTIPVQTAPVQPIQQTIPPQVPVQPVPPVQQATSVVQTTAVTYTADDLARAAMALMDSGHQQELIGLLQQFGVTALPELPPAQYGAFATALRGMGAQI